MKNPMRSVLSERSRRGIRFDARRLGARLKGHWRRTAPSNPRLHLGCGNRIVPGWFNVDVSGSDFDVDLGAGSLPFPDSVFDAVVCQQVIEHLEMESQLEPLLDELRRTCRPGAEIWLACPDMERICRSYLEDGGTRLLTDRLSRWPEFSLGGAPPSHMLNDLFHQAGEHVNLFDFTLLSWLLEKHGLGNCTRTDEVALLNRFPEFPRRNDDTFSLYVRAQAP